MNEDVFVKECEANRFDVKFVKRIKESFIADGEANLGMFQFTLLMVKSYSLDKKHLILEEVSSAGLRVVATKRAVLGRMDVVRFAVIRANGKRQPLNVRQHSAMLESLLKGSLEAFIVAGANAVERLRGLLGPEDPVEARRDQPESLRARFGGDVLSDNGLHCSVKRNEAHEELSLIFPNYIDLLKTKGYETQVDQWLFSLWRTEPHRSIFKNHYLDIQRFSANGEVDRTPEFIDRVLSVPSLLRRTLSNCLSAITTLLPFKPTTSSSVSKDDTPIPSASILPLSQEEEEQIACAALADELGVSDLSQFFPVQFTSFLTANERLPVLSEVLRHVVASPSSEDEEEFIDASDDGEWLRPHDFSHLNSQHHVAVGDSTQAVTECPAESKAFSDTFLTRPGGPSLAQTGASEVASAVEMHWPARTFKDRPPPRYEGQPARMYEERTQDQSVSPNTRKMLEPMENYGLDGWSLTPAVPVDKGTPKFISDNLLYCTEHSLSAQTDLT